jgi:A/G-specific adenine glycosylase
MSKYSISNSLITWYNYNKRDLPWRNINDPYKIWVSEIILQQTRVAQGTDYYHRFIERFTNIESLAKAHEDDVLKYWQGLGYYSRARNMHTAALQIMQYFGGKFPTDFKNVLSLKGIGNYTASAICSFAYNQPFAVVDGNVYRVLARLFNIDTAIDSNNGQKVFAQLAQELLDPQKAADHNQAIMEFGSLQCVPASPDCRNCVLNDICLAYRNNTVGQLPRKTQKVKIKKRYFNYLHIQFEGKSYLKKRTDNDIWRNLYEFPLIETDKLLSIDELLKEPILLELFKNINSVSIDRVSSPIKHILTHRQIFAQFFSITIQNKNKEIEQFVEIDENSRDKYAVSRLMELFFENSIFYK